MKTVAIVGYGNIGKKHRKAIETCDSLKITAIIDPYFKSEENQEIQVFSSLADYLNQSAHADIASICTPNGLHAEQSIACMKKGMHVLIEKPMAIDKASAERILATSLETNTRVFCVMQLRYSPIVSWIKNMLEKNKLGDIFSIEVRCFWNRNKNYYQPSDAQHHWRGTLDQDKGPLFTQFSHFVDLVYYLVGAWQVRHVEFNNFNHQDYTEFEDSGHIVFNVGETAGSFSYTTAVHEKNFESTITIIGSKGTISIGGQYFNQIRYSNPDSLPKINEQELEQYAQDRLAGHVSMYNNILDVLDSKNTITTNALDGLKVVEMIEAVYELRSV